MTSPWSVDAAQFANLLAIDVRSLQLFRIGLGILLLLDIGLRARNLRAHYTDAGAFPRLATVERFGGEPARWSLHLLSGSAWFQALLFVCAAIFSVMLLVG